MFNVKLSYCFKGKIKSFDVHCYHWVEFTAKRLFVPRTQDLNVDVNIILYLQTFNSFIDHRCLLLLFSKTINVHQRKIYNIFVQALETGRKVSLWQAFLACFVVSRNTFLITEKKCTTRPYSSLMVRDVQNT